MAIGLIALLTLEPIPRQAPLSASTPWYCLVCGGLGTVDILLNLALFVPLGLTLYRLGFGPLQGALLGFGISLGVELLQATLVAGRDPSLSDLLTNTTGTLLGGLLGARLPRLVSPEAPRARRLALGASAGWLGLLGFTGWAIQPVEPVGAISLRKAPIMPHVERFRGPVHSLALNGQERQPGKLPDSIAPAMSNRIGIEAEVGLAAWTESVAPVVDIVDARWNTIMQLGQLGQKVTFMVRTRSELLKLRAPSAKVYRALPAPEGQAVRVGGELAGSTLRAYAVVGGETRAAETRLTPGLGWMLVLPLGRYPFDYRPEVTSAVWTALPLLLVGFWTGRAGEGWRWSLLAWATVLGLGLLAIPPLTGTAGQGWGAWLACVAALLLGRLVASTPRPAALPSAHPAHEAQRLRKRA